MSMKANYTLEKALDLDATHLLDHLGELAELVDQLGDLAGGHPCPDRHC